MQKLGRLKCVVIPALCVVTQTAAFCQGQPGQDRFSVQEMQEGANTEYNVINNSSDLFAISAFAIKTTGGNPTTANPNWIAETLNASSWLQPMGGDSALPSWLDYTGLTYMQAFPADPAELNAYVVDDPGVAGGGVISPGNSLAGFFFQGTAASTDRFMFVNDHGPAIIEGQIITAFGTVEVVPEPNIIALLGLGSAVLILGIYHRRYCPFATTFVST